MLGKKKKLHFANVRQTAQKAENFGYPIKINVHCSQYKELKHPYVEELRS